MDVVLEVFDTFVFDRLYATVLPAFPQGSLYSKPSRPDATFSSMRQMPTAAYVYEPASRLLNLEPSDFAYMSRWPRTSIYRQALSLFFITWLFGFLLYIIAGSLSYYFIFDKTAFQHPKYLRNQIKLEMKQAFGAMPWIAILTTVPFILEVRGFSKMYDTTAEGPGRWYDVLQFPLFLIFTDFCIYWIHRGLHHPILYKRLHKAHHKWVVPTPFASHAFHPIDGFAQSVPYHVFPFIFPLNKFAYIALFLFINLWTVMIHDGEYAMNSKIINGAACHTMHHLFFNFNYGQYTTLWDRLGGSYRPPNEELFRRQDKMSKAEWERQSKEAEAFIRSVEGEDDRVYLPDGTTCAMRDVPGGVGGEGVNGGVGAKEGKKVQ